MKNPNDFSTAQLECYLDIVVFFSTVFDTPMVRADAVAVFQTPAKSPATELFDLHALAAWLNVANGSVALSTPVDVGGVSTTFGAAMLAAEDVRTNVASTDAEVRAAQEVVSYLATVSE